MTTSNTTDQASAGELGRALVGGWLLLLVLGLVGACTSLGVSLLMPDRYTGTVTALVKIPTETSDAETLIRTLESLVTSTVVLADVAEQPGVDLSVRDIGSRLTVERDVGSAVIEVSFEDTSTGRVQAVVSSITPALNNQLGQVSAPEGLVPLSVDTFGAPPYVRETSYAPVPSAIVGGFAGLLLGGLIIVVRMANRRT